MNFFSVYVISDIDFPSLETFPLTLILCLSVLGAASTNERVHGVIGIVAFLNLTVGFGMLFVQAV